MSKLLVTGGAGFIGSNFIRFWLTRHPEDEVTNLDLLTYAGNLQNLADIAEHPKYHFVHGDICDVELVDRLVRGVDAIVHFAAESHVDRSIVGPAAFLRTNVQGTFVLLEAARTYGIRFHNISTDEVFGALTLNDGRKFREDTPYEPRSPYAASKAAADHLVRAYGNTYGVAVTITNCSNNFGPYQHPEKFIPRLITNLLDGGTAKVYGDGLYVRDWLHVEDHCRAIERVLETGRIGETYLVGGLTDDVNNLAVTKQILATLGLGEDRIEHVADRPGHDRRYAVDWGKIQRELGWEPEWNFNDWLRTTVEWYRQHETWWRPLKDEAERMYAATRAGERAEAVPGSAL